MGLTHDVLKNKILQMTIMYIAFIVKKYRAKMDLGNPLEEMEQMGLAGLLYYNNL